MLFAQKAVLLYQILKSRDIYVDEISEMFRCQMNGEG